MSPKSRRLQMLSTIRLVVEHEMCKQCHGTLHIPRRWLRCQRRGLEHRRRKPLIRRRCAVGLRSLPSHARALQQQAGAPVCEHAQGGRAYPIDEHGVRQPSARHLVAAHRREPHLHRRRALNRSGPPPLVPSVPEAPLVSCLPKHRITNRSSPPRHQTGTNSSAPLPSSKPLVPSLCLEHL
jgi:hypothetical protein